METKKKTEKVDFASPLKDIVPIEGFKAVDFAVELSEKFYRETKGMTYAELQKYLKERKTVQIAK